VLRSREELGFVTIAEITAGPSTTLPRISCRDPGFDDLHAALLSESRTRGRR